MYTNRPERLRTFDYLGPYRYFLTFCTNTRHLAFQTDETVRIVLAQILRAANALGFSLIAYVFMPDHVHLLVEGLTDDSDCRAFIKLAKQCSGFHYERRFGRRLWQRYGYEHTLRDEEATLSVARYVIENPVRARLVERVEDYPYLGSSMYTIEQICEAIQMAPRWKRSRSA